MALCVFDIHHDGSTSVPAEQNLRGSGRYRWWHFDVADPELATWAQANMPDIPAAALLDAETRPRCDRYQNGLILNLRGINMNEGQPAAQMVSVRMWVEQDVIVTARVRRVFALEEIRQSILSGTPPDTVGAFLCDLVGRLTDRVQTEVLKTTALAEMFEDVINEDTISDLPAELGETRRNVIRLKRYLNPQRTALHNLATNEAPVVSDADRLELRELSNQTIRIVEELDSLRDQMKTVQEHYDMQAALWQNRNSYALSAIAAVFLPLGFLTGLFGVNVGGMPGIDQPAAFAVLSISMVLIAAVAVGILRWKRWL